jgi:hypothetical protein
MREHNPLLDTHIQKRESYRADRGRNADEENGPRHPAHDYR